MRAPHGTESAGVPVNQALKLAIEEALQAQKGPVLPALLLSGLSAAAGGGSVGSSSGWAAAGSSRLVAALSAAEINMNLRTKVGITRLLLGGTTILPRHSTGVLRFEQLVLCLITCRSEAGNRTQVEVQP